MTNSQRRALEDAIISYGSAKSLYAAADSNPVRKAAHKAVTVTWNVIQDLMDEIDADHNS